MSLRQINKDYFFYQFPQEFFQLRDYFHQTAPQSFRYSKQPYFTFVETFKHIHKNYFEIMERAQELYPNRQSEIFMFLPTVRLVGALWLGAHGTIPIAKILATDEQFDKIYKAMSTGRLFGAYAQTEIGHGSDVQSLEIVSHYDPETKQFTFNSPNGKATKFWPGNMGITATDVILQAQTFVKGKYIGLQTYFFPIRDNKTHKTLEGVEVGDIGPKLSFKYTDNGYLRFNNYKVPKDALLARFIKLGDDGAILEQADKKTMKVAYGGMLYLRVGLVKYWLHEVYKNACAYYTGLKARGSIPVDSKRNLIDQFAFTYTGMYSQLRIQAQYLQYQETVLKDLKKGLAMLSELHTLAAGMKSYYSSRCVELTRDSSINQPLGGLLNSGCSQIYGDEVPGVTYEGDNTVMYQQTARDIFKYLGAIESDKKNKIPPSAQFLVQYTNKDNNKPFSIMYPEDLLKHENLVVILQQSLALRCAEVFESFKQKMMAGGKMQAVWNDDEQKEIVLMAAAYIEIVSYRLASEYFKEQKSKLETKEQGLLDNLISLNGVNILKKHLNDIIRFGVINENALSIEKYLKSAEGVIVRSIETDIPYMVESCHLYKEELGCETNYRQINSYGKEELVKKGLEEVAGNLQRNMNMYSKL